MHLPADLSFTSNLCWRTQPPSIAADVTATTPTPDLLSLPRELQDLIYSYLTQSTHIKCRLTPEKHYPTSSTLAKPLVRIKLRAAVFPVDISPIPLTSFLLVNRQIHAEYTDCPFFRNVSIAIHFGPYNADGRFVTKSCIREFRNEVDLARGGRIMERFAPHLQHLTLDPTDLFAYNDEVFKMSESLIRAFQYELGAQNICTVRIACGWTIRCTTVSVINRLPATLILCNWIPHWAERPQIKSLQPRPSSLGCGVRSFCRGMLVERSKTRGGSSLPIVNYWSVCVFSAEKEKGKELCMKDELEAVPMETLRGDVLSEMCKEFVFWFDERVGEGVVESVETG